MKAEMVEKGLWYKIYTDDGEYLGQVMQRLGSLNRPLGKWAFGVKDQPVSFGHNFTSLQAAAIALQKKLEKPAPKCKRCNGTKVWNYYDNPVPCPDCNPNA